MSKPKEKAVITEAVLHSSKQQNIIISAVRETEE